MTPRIAITLGDPNGIGPEVVVKALEVTRGDDFVPLVYGAPEVWAQAVSRFGRIDLLPGWGRILACDDTTAIGLEYGRTTAAGGRAALNALAPATEALKGGDVDGLCTAPLSKAAVGLERPGFIGHTEYLQEAFGLPRVVMLMASPQMNVALATTHVALSKVGSMLTSDGLVEVLQLTSLALGRSLGRTPRLAVCGLNPHAGEGGAFGEEEGRIIAPAIERARAAGMEVEGPFAADGLFARWDAAGFDGALAMFHDQGLVPFKMRAFHDGVNVTLGLPRPRTSPDHGTAFDIAGQGVADERSMVSALRLCARLARD